MTLSSTQRKLVKWGVATILMVQISFNLLQIRVLNTSFSFQGLLNTHDLSVLANQVLPIVIVFLLLFTLFLFIKNNPIAIWVYAAAIFSILLKLYALHILYGLLAQEMNIGSITSSPSVYLTNMIKTVAVFVMRLSSLVLILFLISQALNIQRGSAGK